MTDSLGRLLIWLSPSFPVGAYSYSHGLERAVEDGAVTDAGSLAAWVGDVLCHGAGLSDAILFDHAHRAVAAGDAAALAEVSALAAALAPSRERRLESLAQGAAFLAAAGAAWPTPALAVAQAAAPEAGTAYPVAVAAACAGHGIAAPDALRAFVQAFAANLVSAGVRLVPLGQSDGLRALAALEPVVAATAAAAPGRPLDDIGGAAFAADIASMRHETQYTRLFRS